MVSAPSTPGTGTGFTVPNTGAYKVSFSVTASGTNQLEIRVNNAVTGNFLTFGAEADQPNVGTALLPLVAGDVITLQNLTSAGDVVLPVKVGGTANSVNAWIVIEQLNGQ